jgi:hypothetical protein
MARFIVIDPEINAHWGIVDAPNQRVALNFAARKMGWADYADLAAAAERHRATGVRLLETKEISRPALRLVS